MSKNFSLSLKFNKRNTTFMIEATSEKKAIEFVEKFTYNKVISSSEVLKLDSSADGKVGGRNVKVLARSKKAKAIRQFLFHDIKVSNRVLAQNIKKFLLIGGKKIDFVFPIR